jgi:anti-sigma factor ChrR (cupin superfamily)
MNINAEFAQRVVIHSPSLEWQDSPIKGVKRRMLDRVGGEVARATSIVSYDPSSKFSSHVHTGGEEFVVLEGVFQDEHGDFPVGSYIRNPPESSHTPGSEPGCVIFVKLWQFDLNDRTHIRTDMEKAGFVTDASRQGVQVSTLFADDREQVRLEKWEANTSISVNTDKGAEILVLDGGFTEGNDELKSLSWMRLPIGSAFTAQTGAAGAKVWIKTGHLIHAEEEANRLPESS